MDDTIRKMRADWHSHTTIAKRLGVTAATIINRCEKLGIPTRLPPLSPQVKAPPPCTLARDALPPGHPVSWGAISAAAWPAEGGARHG